MNLIDRYVYAVTEHLPETIREDVSKELRANIEDMLPENPSEENVRRVLEELGNPRKLADEYNPTKRYLIGPSLYDSYITVLKLVTGIVAIVLVCITLIQGIFQPEINGDIYQNIVETIVKSVTVPIEGIMQAAIWVTIIFAIHERIGMSKWNIPFQNNKWTVDDLPTKPISEKRKISRGETIFSMVCTVFFTAIFYFQPGIIALYTKGGNGSYQGTPVFDVDRLHSYLIIILILALIELCMFTWKLIVGNWTYPLAIGNAIQNSLICILVLVMVRDQTIFNQEFITAISGYMNMSLDKLISIWDINIVIFTVVFIAVSLWDSIAAFMKCRK